MGRRSDPFGCFDARTIERSRAYRGDRIVLVEGDPEGVASARIRGTRWYHVDLYLSDEGYWGRCSCPVAIDCKHAAALARVVNEGRPPERRLEDDVGEWLTGLADSIDGPARPAASHDQIAYLLLEDGGRHRIRVMRGKQLKSGRLGRLRPLRPHYHRELPPWIEPLEARRVLAVMHAYAGYSESAPMARLDRDLVQQLVDAGRLFDAEARSAPLCWGPERVARLVLSRRRKDRFQLALDPDLAPLDTPRPLYLDRASGSVGPLSLEGVAEPVRFSLERLLGGPDIPASSLDTAVRSLRSLTGVDIALPAGVEVEGEALEVRPLLEIERREPEWRGGAWGYTLEASALYKRGRRRPVKVPLGQPAAAEVPRDLVTEERHRRRLERLAGGDFDFAPHRPSEREAQAERISLEIVPRLRAEGWQVEVAPDLDLEVGPAPELIESLVPAGEGGWFAYEIGVEVGGKVYSLLPLLLTALERAEIALDLRRQDDQAPGVDLTLPGGEPLHIPAARLRRWLRPLLELQLRGLEGGMLRLSPLAVASFDDSELPGDFAAGAALAELRQNLASLVDVDERREPASFGAALRGYQRRGLAWLRFLADAGLGGILADDMGLGKTVQILALLEELRLEGELGEGRPALVLAPRSVVGNWRNEARRFAPDIDAMVHLGPNRARAAGDLEGRQLVITSYATFLRDADWMRQLDWRCLVLDEAQAIKNPDTKLRRAVARLQAGSRFCATGTPIENHLGELWSQADVVMPGLLGSRKGFRTFFQGPIEKQGDADRLEFLRRRIRPFMLRRSKGDVDLELPEKSEIVEPVELRGDQRDLYETLRLALDKNVRDALARRGVGGSSMVVLEALLRLRQTCCDPRIVKLEAARGVAASAKLERLMEMLEELAGAGRHTLVFSQFTSMLKLIEAECRRRGIATLKLTGRTRKRDQVIAQFQRGEAPVFLISLKAGGVGLNLTRADTVIHYDPWWNPAVEDQATDRAHRIGQDKPVFVYKLVAAGSVEDRIVELQQKKQSLTDAALTRGGFGHFSADDIEALFRPLD